MPVLRFNSTFDQPYYTGGGSSTLVPYIAEVALGGHAYRIDWSADIPLRHTSVPLLRQQSDDSRIPGEQSINPEALWRRVGESWHVGAGQEHFDREQSNPYRFRDSYGWDVWDKWRLSLLPDTDIKLASANTNLRVAVAGGFLYLTDGATIKRFVDMVGDTPTPTTLTGHPANEATSIVTNGNYVWTAHGTNGIHRTTRGTAATASQVTGTVSLLGFVKNRLLAAQGASLYDATTVGLGASGALPAAHFTHGNVDWSWIGFAQTQGFIYAAGFSGDKSLIYSMVVKPDATALDQPIIAGELPDGEIVTSIYGYLGRFLAIGTTSGFRLALVAESGALTLGSLIENDNPVLCFEGQGEFIWYGAGLFDTALTDGVNLTGLGRLSTTTFSDLDSFVPAYANDLSVSGQTANITSLATFQDLRIFTLTGVGLYAQHATNLTATANLRTGPITFGLTELKTGFFVDIQHESTDGTLNVYMAVNGGGFVDLGVATPVDGLSHLTVGETVGTDFEISLVGTRDSDPTLGPTIHYWLFRAQPRPTVTNVIYATIFLAPVTESITDQDLMYVTGDELEYIERINTTKEVITWQEGLKLYTVVLDDYEMDMKRLLESEDGMFGFNGSCTLKLKRII